MNNNTTFQNLILLVLLLVCFFAYRRLRLKTLKSYKSPLLGKVKVVQKYSGEKILMTNDFVQGISIEQKDIDQSYWYRIAKEAVKFCKDKKNPRVLFLGMGANASSSLVAKMDSRIHQTFIEIDPLIVQANKEFFGLENLPKYDVKIVDVFELIKQDKPFRKLFDVIIIDVYKAEKPFIVEDTNQPHFINRLLNWLKKDGLLIFNRPAHNQEMRRLGEKLFDHLDNNFNKVKFFDIKDPRGYRNYVICATINKTRL